MENLLWYTYVKIYTEYSDKYISSKNLLGEYGYYWICKEKNDGGINYDY